MKRIFLIPIAVVALAVPAMVSAAGLSLAYKTGNFNFTDSTLTTGYLGFTMNGNQLDVNVSSAGSISGIPSISVLVYGPTTDAMGRDVYPTFGQLGNVTLDGSGGWAGMNVLHDNATVADVANAYRSALTGLGFKADQVSTGTPDVIAYDFTMNGNTLRAVFHKSGPDSYTGATTSVTAHLAVVPSVASA